MAALGCGVLEHAANVLGVHLEEEATLYHVGSVDRQRANLTNMCVHPAAAKEISGST